MGNWHLHRHINILRYVVGNRHYVSMTSAGGMHWTNLSIVSNVLSRSSVKSDLMLLISNNRLNDILFVNSLAKDWDFLYPISVSIFRFQFHSFVVKSFRG